MVSRGSHRRATRVMAVRLVTSVWKFTEYETKRFQRLILLVQEEVNDCEQNHEYRDDCPDNLQYSPHGTKNCTLAW